MTGLLRNERWRVNHKRVERIWRQEGLKVPKQQPARRRLWLTDGSRIRLRATHPNHVWAYDCMATRTEDGRPVKLLTIVDEYSRECLAIDVARRLRSDDVGHNWLGVEADGRIIKLSNVAMPSSRICGFASRGESCVRHGVG